MIFVQSMCHSYSCAAFFGIKHNQEIEACVLISIFCYDVPLSLIPKYIIKLKKNNLLPLCSGKVTEKLVKCSTS